MAFFLSVVALTILLQGQKCSGGILTFINNGFCSGWILVCAVVFPVSI